VGDARLENAVVADDLTVRAVLDWDMTTVGARWHDLAWFTSLDTSTERLFGRRLPGWPDREATIARYETLALVRSTALMTRLGYLRRAAGEAALLPIDDNPMLDLLRERIT